MQLLAEENLPTPNIAACNRGRVYMILKKAKKVQKFAISKQDHQWQREANR